MKYSILTLLFAALLVVSNLAAGQESPALTLKTRIALPKVKGRFDHMSVDLKGERLFVAAVGNHTLEVIDLKSGQRVHTIANLDEPQGVFYDASSNRLFVACGGDGRTNIYDASTFGLVASAKFPADADNLRYDSHDKLVVVGYAGAKHVFGMKEEGTGALGFLDANGKLVREIPIDAHPESFRLEESGSRIFVNVPEKREIEVLDRIKLTVLARWPVMSAQDNFPMTLDEAHHRLFVATWKPSRMLVFDTDSGKEIASGETAGASDDLFYDAQRGRIYVLTDAGYLDVFQDRDHSHYDRIARYPTPLHTQTGLFVPEWGMLFAAAQAQTNQSAEIRVYQAN